MREGYNVRVYVPFGTQWYPYLMRRLAERPANVAFMTGNVVKEIVRGRKAKQTPAGGVGALAPTPPRSRPAVPPSSGAAGDDASGASEPRPAAPDAKKPGAYAGSGRGPDAGR